MKDKYTKFIIIILFLSLWEISARIVNSELIIPKIETTISHLFTIIQSKDFYIVIFHSMRRSITGFSIAVMLGIFAGLVSFANKFLKEIFFGISKFCASIPTVAIILLILIWFKSNTVSMLIGMIMVFPIIYQSVYSSIIDYDKNIIQMLNLYKIPMSKRIIKVYIPKIFADIKKIINSSFLINFKMVIAGEVISQPKYAIGTKLYFEKIYINTAGVFAWIIVILCLSIIMDKVLNLIFRYR